MALNLPLQILFTFLTQLRPTGDEEGGPLVEIQIDERLTNGSAAGQATHPIKEVRTLAAGASETIDWTTIVDGNGDAINAAEVVFWGIIADPGNGAGIQIDDTPANPWSSFIRSTGATDDAQIEIPPAGFIIAGTVADPAYAVAAGNRAFQVTNLDGANAATYTIFAATRIA